MRGTVELVGMEFVCRHGCLESEKLNDNLFVVDFCGVYDMEKAAASDDLGDAVDYGSVYDLVAGEMKRPAELLEHLAGRIVAAIAKAHPELEEFSVRVAKQNPPVAGKTAWSAITIAYPYE